MLGKTARVSLSQALGRLVLFSVALAPLPCAAETTALGVSAAAFSAQPPGEEPTSPWRLQTYTKIPRHTRFTLIDDGGTTVLQARAENAAASLTRPLAVDLTATPWLRWRWKPLSAPDKTTLNSKESDDWGARIYVLFEPPPASVGFGERLALGIARTLYGDDVPARGICYVWLPGGKVGDSAANAFTDRLKMIVVDSAAPGDWRSLARNVAADYLAAFGEPLAPVSGFAVSADSDNGGGTADVLFADISFSAEPQ